MEIASPFLVEAEAAALLRLKPSTLQNWRTLGDGPPFQKLGGRIVYDRQGVIAWARAKTRMSTSDDIEAA